LDGGTVSTESGLVFGFTTGPAVVLVRAVGFAALAGSPDTVFAVVAVAPFTLEAPVVPVFASVPWWSPAQQRAATTRSKPMSSLFLAIMIVSVSRGRPRPSASPRGMNEPPGNHTNRWGSCRNLLRLLNAR
jgi:hypothetical protein